MPRSAPPSCCGSCAADVAGAIASRKVEDACADASTHPRDHRSAVFTPDNATFHPRILNWPRLRMR